MRKIVLSLFFCLFIFGCCYEQNVNHRANEVVERRITLMKAMDKNNVKSFNEDGINLVMKDKECEKKSEDKECE